MKVDFLRKAKWYIVGFILVAIMLSVSLSFCAWDTLSAKAVMNAKGGDFIEKPNTKYVLVDDLYLSNGTKVENGNGNGIADVGDIVTFGNYYQDANTSTKSPIRWRVVDKVGTTLTLLAEKVMAFGSFWGTYYYNSGNGGVYGATQAYNPNYMQSTVRAWLNSGVVEDDNGKQITLSRTDGGTPFSKIYDSSKPQFRGFLSEAFTPDEQSYILPKTISGMKGWNQSNGLSNPGSISTDYGSGNDKVWLPSYIEMYSNTGISWGTASDNLKDNQFEYFKSSAADKKVAKTTKYASTLKSNYTMDTSALAGTQNYQVVPMGSESPVWWWLRSPYPSYWRNSLYVGSSGDYGSYDTSLSYGGVRPAVCLPL